MLLSTFIVRLCGLELRFTAKNTNSIAFLDSKGRTYEGQWRTEGEVGLFKPPHQNSEV
jgi:hypothetical protein